MWRAASCLSRVLRFRRPHERHLRRVRLNNLPTLLATSHLFPSAQAGNVFAFTADISQSKSALEAIIRLIDARPEIDSEATDGKALESVTGKIGLRIVYFRYSTHPTARVLRGFNLTVEPGTHIALVGASGCGKSTVIQVSLLCH